MISRDNADVDDGWLCDRGRYGFEMFDAAERVTGPRLRGGGTDWAEAIAKAAEGLRAGGARSAAIVGDASNEEGFVVQRILRDALGAADIDSRPSRGPSREALLRLDAPDLSARVRDIDDADAILVVGTDPLHDSPILDLRVRKAMRRNGARLVLATDRPTALDGGAHSATRFAPGGATAFLSELAAALRDGGREGDAAEAAAALGDAGRVVILWGDRIGREGDGAHRALLDVAAVLGMADREGSGLMEIPTATNARGLREAGCLPDAGPGLAATGAPNATAEGANGARVGRSTEEIRAALEAGEISSLLLFGVDPLRDFPDSEAWRRAIAAADHVVAFSVFENETTAMADVVLPLETHAEKDGTLTHPDGRLQRVRPSAGRPGDIRPNWGVLAELALALDLDTGVTSQPTAFAALADAVPFYAGLTDSDIKGRGIRWQDREAAASFPKEAGAGSPGTPHEGAPGESVPASLSETPREGAPSDPGSLVLGTYRDLWAGPITELNPPLRFLEPRQQVEMSASDAERLGLAHGDHVKVGQNGSSVTARVVIKERMRDGAVFLIEGVADGNANALLNGGPVSVTIEKIATPPRAGAEEAGSI